MLGARRLGELGGEARSGHRAIACQDRHDGRDELSSGFVVLRERSQTTGMRLRQNEPVLGTQRPRGLAADEPVQVDEAGRTLSGRHIHFGALRQLVEELDPIARAGLQGEGAFDERAAAPAQARTQLAIDGQPRGMLHELIAITTDAVADLDVHHLAGHPPVDLIETEHRRGGVGRHEEPVLAVGDELRQTVPIGGQHRQLVTHRFQNGQRARLLDSGAQVDEHIGHQHQPPPRVRPDVERVWDAEDPIGDAGGLRRGGQAELEAAIHGAPRDHQHRPRAALKHLAPGGYEGREIPLRPRADAAEGEKHRVVRAQPQLTTGGLPQRRVAAVLRGVDAVRDDRVHRCSELREALLPVRPDVGERAAPALRNEYDAVRRANGARQPGGEKVLPLNRIVGGADVAHHRHPVLERPKHMRHAGQELALRDVYGLVLAGLVRQQVALSRADPRRCALGRHEAPLLSRPALRAVGVIVISVDFVVGTELSDGHRRVVGGLRYSARHRLRLLKEPAYRGELTLGTGHAYAPIGQDAPIGGGSSLQNVDVGQHRWGR